VPDKITLTDFVSKSKKQQDKTLGGSGVPSRAPSLPYR